MLRIPAPTAKDRANQWTDAYDAAEALIAKIFKNSPELVCGVSEHFLELVCDTIAKLHGIPVYIVAAAVTAVANDLHEQYHNPV